MFTGIPYKLTIMSKLILESKDRKEINDCIVRMKFNGVGSVQGVKVLNERFGVSVSRPTFDKYYNNFLGGSAIDECIQELKEEQRVALVNTGSGSESHALIPPAIDQQKLRELKDYYRNKDSDSWDSVGGKIEEIKRVLLLALECNVDAWMDGSERLKPELVKMLSSLK